MTVSNMMANVQRGTNSINTIQQRLTKVQQEYDSITQQADMLQQQINQSQYYQSNNGTGGTSIFSGMMGQYGSQSLYGNGCGNQYGSCMDQMMLDQLAQRQNELEQEKNSLEQQLDKADQQQKADKERMKKETQRSVVSYGGGGG